MGNKIVHKYYAEEKGVELCGQCGKMKLDKFSKVPCDDGVKRCNSCGFNYEVGKTADWERITEIQKERNCDRETAYDIWNEDTTHLENGE